MNKKELSSLINLLDDPDVQVFSNVKEKLILYGKEIIPALENAWETCFKDNALFHSRIEDIIHEIQFKAVLDSLSAWKKTINNDLLQGALLLARYQYPDLDEEKINNQIQQIQQDIWIEMNNFLTALEKVKIINHILYDVHGFVGNINNLYETQNVYMNRVLETKLANPISLAVLYIVIAQNLGLPIYGVSIPSYFALAYLDNYPLSSTPDEKDKSDKVLFYIDPFNKGVAFSINEIKNFLSKQNVEPQPEYFQPCTNNLIIERMLGDLIFTYHKQGDVDKAKELATLLKVVKAE